MLRLANSAVFGFNRHVTSVKDAVALIGFEQVADLLTAVSTFEALGRVEESPHFNRLAFWEHSIGCGCIARVIGKVVMDGYFPDYFGEALQTAATDRTSIYDAENKMNPINHEMVGGYLARQWKLPDPIIDVIGAHHTLKPQKSMNARLVLLINVVDAQCRSLGVGNAGDDLSWDPDSRILARLSISRADLQSWKPQMEEAIEHAQGLLDLAG
jgi:HD-like signal output (HDOD) protein